MSILRTVATVLSFGLSVRLPNFETEHQGQRLDRVTVGVGPMFLWVIGGFVTGVVIMPLAVFDVARFLIETTF